MDDPFVKAYHEFRDSIDLTKSGVLPDMDNLVWYLLMGIPRVPADEDTAQNSPYLAIEQRVIILKAVFVEANRHERESFLDQGLGRYDQAGRMARDLLQETA
jgi:hypothetical protein